MPLEDWFRGLGISANDAQNYKTKVTDEGIADDEKELQKLGLTRHDLEALQIKLRHRQTILNGIHDVEQGGETLADDRKDFIRRLFAIAVSVGFAGRLVNMPWISADNMWFDENQIVELARLLVGVFVVVSGWEWYHRALKKYPLNYPWRFYIDVAVVIYTIVFLFSSKKEGVWLFPVVAIFALYVLWGLVLMIEYRTDRNVGSRFITDAIWLLYFFFIFWANNHHPLITCLAVFLGVAGLRALGGLGVEQAVTFRGIVLRVTMVSLLVAGYYVAPRYV